MGVEPSTKGWSLLVVPIRFLGTERLKDLFRGEMTSIGGSRLDVCYGVQSYTSETWVESLGSGSKSVDTSRNNRQKEVSTSQVTFDLAFCVPGVSCFRHRATHVRPDLPPDPESKIGTESVFLSLDSE